jgi:xanthine dehydrogenase molybdenum-binding subunit
VSEHEEVSMVRFEYLKPKSKGEVIYANFRDYEMHAAKDVIPVEPLIVGTIGQDGPYGVKGIGEPGCVSTAPAIGVRIKDLRFTTEKIVRVLRKKEAVRHKPTPYVPGVVP